MKYNLLNIQQKNYLILLVLTFYFFGGKAQQNNLVISEICPINDSIISNPLDDYADWIELYNSGAERINLKGLYVTDSKKNLLKHKIGTDLVLEPASYIILWADTNTTQGAQHLGFKLSIRETLILYHPSSGIIDSLTLGYAGADVSIGRQDMDKNAPWKYFTTPTPGSKNNTDAFEGYTSSPQFNKTADFYNGNISIELTAKEGENIYYTLNCTDPDIKDSTTFQYNGTPIIIDKTTVIRTRAYKDGWMPGLIASNTYFIDTSYNLPVLSIMMDPIDVIGPKGFHNHPWLEGYAWERFSQHQFFIDNQLEYSGNSGIRIQGGNSVGMAKKSFRLHFKSQYGFDRMRYKMFTHSDQKSFRHIVLRAGYDDDLTEYSGTLLRDPLSSDFMRIIGNLSSASEWTILFLNNQYRGIYNIRESVDEHFIADHLGTESFDMIRYQKNGPELKFGSWEEWNKLESFFDNTDFSLPESYDLACDLIDMNNFLNLLAFVHCSQFRSWTWGASAYKIRNASDKWKWTIWDTDRAYSTLTWNGFNEYAYLANEKWPNFMPQKLILNSTFQNKLINRTADFLNSFFLPAKSTAMVDSLKSIIASEVPADKARWNSSINWEKNVNKINTFLTNRPETVRQQIKNYFKIKNTVNVELKTDGLGKILINSLDIKHFPWNGIYFENIPIDITAIPENGYKFVKWSNGDLNPSLSKLSLASDTSLTAIFEIDTQSVYNIVINEIMYHEFSGLPSKEWIEIYNMGGQQDLSGWWITDKNPSNMFKIPQGTYIQKNEYMVICEDLLSFYNINEDSPYAIGSFGMGINAFGLDNSNDCIKLYSKKGRLIDSVCYKDDSPWPKQADGNGPSLQLLDPQYDNSIAKNWQISFGPYFTPGIKNQFTTEIQDVYSKSKHVNIYPNPVNDLLYIEAPLQSNNETLKISVYSAYGKLMNEQYYKYRSGIIQLNTSFMPNGIYIIKVQSGNDIYAEKLIKF